MCLCLLFELNHFSVGLGLSGQDLLFVLFMAKFGEFFCLATTDPYPNCYANNSKNRCDEEGKPPPGSALVLLRRDELFELGQELVWVTPG